MDRPPGTRAEKRSPDDRAARALVAGGRFAGFCFIALPALAVLAAVVLLPAYARLKNLEYTRDTWQARVADGEALVAAYNRLIKAVPNDPVLNKRLAMSMFGMLPRNEYVVIDPDAPPPAPPTAVRIRPQPRPAQPSGMLMQLGTKLSYPATQRGLFFLTAAALLAAMFFFAPTQLRRRSDTAV